jgi:alpha-tubulin suppressor-like RCC1 family protein
MTQKIYAWGDNSYGLLGNGDAVDKSTPTEITSIVDPISVFSGDLSTFAIKSDNTQWYTGYNDFFNESPNDYFFDQVGTATWSQISVSKGLGTTSFWALGIRTNGTLWFIGDNQYGVRGDGTADSTFYDTWQQIGSATNWTKCSAGFNHAAAVNSSGALYTWGENSGSQLGTGNTTDVFTPGLIASSGYSDVRCGTDSTIAVTTAGAMLGCGTNNSYAIKQQIGTNGTVYNTLTSSNSATWSKFDYADRGGIGITTGDILYIWGGIGQGGFNSTPGQNSYDLRFPALFGGGNPFTGKSGTFDKCRIYAGASDPFFAITTSSKQLYTWGENGQGQLGRGYVSTAPTYYPTTTTSNSITKVADSINELSIGGMDSMFALITVPVASFTTAKVGETQVTFTNTSTDATSYTIDWGDGSSSTVANNSTTGAPGVGTLSHTYTTSADTQYTITLTAKTPFLTGTDLTSTATATFNVFVAQSPSFTVVEQGTGPYVIVRNTSPNTLGATSIFGSGNKWRWEWNGTGTFTDINSGSGTPGDRLVNLQYTFTFTLAEITAAVPVNRTVTLKAFNGRATSPFASVTTNVSVIPTNPNFPNIDTTVSDSSIPDIFYAPKGITWGSST